MRALPLHYARPLAAQVLFAHVLPLGFGAVCGIALGASEPAYVALSVLAAIGGFAAGLEHEGAVDGASRGVAGGLLFGTGLLIAHELAGTTPTVELPDPEVLLIVVTTVAGTVLGAVGGALRGRAERRGAEPKVPGAAEPTRPAAEVDSAATEAAEQHAALTARAERAEQAAAEAQAESRRVAELAQEHDARALSAERRVQDSEQQLARLQEELEQARADAERQQAAAEQRAQDSEQQLTRLREELHQARADAERQQAAGESEQSQLRAGTEELRSKAEAIGAVAAQLESRAEAFEGRAGEVEAAAARAVEEHAALAAKAERVAQAAEEHAAVAARSQRSEWAEQVAKQHAELVARAERAEQAAAQAQAHSQRLEEELGSKTEAVAAAAAQLESRATAIERRADEVEAAATQAVAAAWWPRTEQADAAPAPVATPRVRWEQGAAETAPSGLKWSDPVLDELKRRESEFTAKVERLASELSRRGPEEDVSELRRQLADAEERRDRVRARIEERGSVLFERHRAGGGSAPASGPGR